MQESHQSSIFRKVALDRVSSPDQLDTLLTVVSPVNKWLSGVIAVLIGVLLVWALFGTLTQRSTHQAITSSTETMFFVPFTSAGQLEHGMAAEVSVGGRVVSGEIAEVGANPLTEGELLTWIEDPRWLERFAPNAASVRVVISHRPIEAASDATWANVSIKYGTVRPINLLLPNR